MKSTTLIWTESKPGQWRGRMQGRPEMTLALISSHREGQFRMTAAFQSDMEDRESCGDFEDLKAKAQAGLDDFIKWMAEHS